MYKLYSMRKKEESGIVDVFTYDNFPLKFRNQFWHVLTDLIEEMKEQDCLCDTLYEEICKLFAREIGYSAITFGGYQNNEYALGAFANKCSDEMFLDLFDFICGTLLLADEARESFNLKDDNFFDDAVEEINERLKQNSLGYQCENGQVIRIDNFVTHQQIVKPALIILNDKDFAGAEEEFMTGFEYYKQHKNSDAIANFGKAFESTMKIICSKLKYEFNGTKATAHDLLNVLESNGFYPEYLDNYKSGLKNTLMGAATIRNKEGSHGQGSEIRDVDNCYVEYSINQVSSNIVFLYGLYKEKLQ